MRLISIVVLCACLCGVADAQAPPEATAAVSTAAWKSLGPPGGDVRAIAQDLTVPGHLYLGTTDGHIFGSQDGGEHWVLLGRTGERTDAVVTTILIDPRDSHILFASTWTQDPAAGGGIFKSEDSGHTWKMAGLPGQAVRALAQAPSDPNRLVAGTLDGVFASRDAGRTWQRISPAGSPELRNLDSIAIDPKYPDVLYAGTFHLPWKSADAGHSWSPVHTGMIDDSDVMSILVDRSNPERIYASACSGIYRTENGAALWQKIQGIPFSARRTHVIVQDREHPEIIYAGTTEGLWKSADGGAEWRRTTPADWTINAVELPAGHPGRVLLGTEKRGVLLSEDGGETFREANEGFAHQSVASAAFDLSKPGRILAVLAHATEPILATDDGGESWMPLGSGPVAMMKQVKRVFAAPDGWWATLKSGGLIRYDEQQKLWIRAGLLYPTEHAPAAPAKSRAAQSGSGKPNLHRVDVAASNDAALNAVVNDLAFSGTRWYAATEDGLLVSRNRGVTWERLPLGVARDLAVSSVCASEDGSWLWAVSLRGLAVSTDEGHTWHWRDLPFASGGAQRIELVSRRSADGSGDQTVVALARKGLYISRDAGNSWEQAASGLPQIPVEDIAIAGNLFVASLHTGGLYVSTDVGRTWNRIAGGLAQDIFPAVATDSGRMTLLAASAADGLYLVDLGATGAVPSTNLTEGTKH
jgi:photosystem II stability/assembly factor-like uncharacterized protein